ncbi:MAG TPA: AtpZ/AtpI family protein [Candidatus Limnocylindria bacterium]|jgi:ATP synthase protein I|nr:AtpZ/AtpI family protein [Candidatus Limnocylindria bacterium]
MAVPVIGPERVVDDDENGRDAGASADAGASRNIGIAFDLGLRLGISVILGLGGGLLLDNWLHTIPIFTLIGMVLGIGAAMYTIWDVARDAMRR